MKTCNVTTQKQKVTKYLYEIVIQQYYTGSYGWEDVSNYETNSNGLFITNEERLTFNSDYREYKTLGYPTRTINRKTLRK